ncbi:MAG: MBOAT family protein [Calditrichaeota bacterium]|nr:MBOAT family protein [Calditrichota bacterium]
MNFNSFEFFIFLLIVYVIYLSLKLRLQNWFLLLASYLFYAFWDWRFLGLILLSTTTDFFCAWKIDQHDFRKDRRKYLLVSLFVNLTMLGFFKYFHFFADNLFALLQNLGIQLHQSTLRVILPIGISFYTFQTMSYTIDVYRQKIKPTKNFIDYALYVAFFPKLIAGPIERAGDFLPQIEQQRTLTTDKLKNGLLLIYWGLFKKVVIADNLGTMISYFGARNGSDLSAALVWGTLYGFAIQLYADFSAYTDIARGAARLMGFELSQNFHNPVFSRNIQDFWQRWHISLTSWFKDYVFLPLAMVKWRYRPMIPYAAIFVTFLLVGLWHGAGWNFLFWGAYNGAALAIYHFVRRKKNHQQQRKFSPVRPLGDFIAIVVTLNFVIIGLILFRAPTLARAAHCFWLILSDFSFGPSELDLLLKIAAYAAPLLIAEIFLAKNNNDLSQFFRLPLLIRFGILYLMLFLMVVYHAEARNFIYFQF